MKSVFKNLVSVVLVITLLLIPTQVSAANQKVLALTFKTSQDFILGETNATVSFKLQTSAKSVKVSIVDSLGKTIMTYNIGALKANTKKKVTWNGKNSKNKLVAEGYYSVKVVADKTTGKSSTLYARKQKDFAGGNGSKTKPYLVSNVKQLDNVRKYNGKYFRQTKDIDFEFTGIEPMFSEEMPFNGNYDGKGFKILNLTITKPDNDLVALFACVGDKGKITNVSLGNVTITGGEYTAGLVSKNKGNLMYCEVNGTIIGKSKKRYTDSIVGGICAISEGVIDSSQSSGIVSASCQDGNSISYCGGIVGINLGNLKSCQSDMDVNSSVTGEYYNYSYSGGIAGNNESIINNCMASGNITSTDISRNKDCYAGGIVGMNSGQVTGSQYGGSSVTADTVSDTIALQK